MDYNKIALTGRLTRYREVRYTLAGGNQKTDCIPIVVWGKTAATCGNNLVKGRKVLVDGRLHC